MFGPNVVPSYSHRDIHFKKMFSEFEELMRNFYNLEKQDIVLYITGSGTLANEIVLSSLSCPVVTVTDGIFSDRIRNTYDLYCNDKNDDGSICAAVQYETSVSKYNRRESISSIFVDAISASPYYDCDAPITTTVLSKQFGFRTGTSLIIIRDPVNTLKLFKTQEHTYLSLMKYVEYAQRQQTPNTPNIHGLEETVERMRGFDVREFRRTIDSRRNAIEEACCGKSDTLQINGEGPVITFTNIPQSIIDKYELYTNSGRAQVFLWTGMEKDYEEFIKDLREV